MQIILEIHLFKTTKDSGNQAVNGVAKSLKNRETTITAMSPGTTNDIFCSGN